MPLPLIALTQGDPAGIGPEQCLKAVADSNVLAACRPAIIGDRSVLAACAKQLGLPLPARVVTEAEALQSELASLEGGAIVDCAQLHDPIVPGVPTAAAGAVSYHYLTVAAAGVANGAFDAITTAPITKLTLSMAGIHEPGHTEIFARLTATENFAMMLYSPRLTVSLVTCHQALREIPAALTRDQIARVIDLTGQTLRALRGRDPRLAVLGLNPHAGESGLFGDEDERIIRPAVEAARRAGWNVEGPLSPDAAFMPRALERYDGHVVMYHDQGLIPFKMISLHDGVNITMGLPIIRTSVDHGTAYDIAWQGKAEVSSLVSALTLAARLAAACKTAPRP